PELYPRELDFAAIDFGFCFGAPDWDESLPSTAGRWCGSCFPEMCDTITGTVPFRIALEKLGAIDEPWLDQLISAVPSDWGLTTDLAGALKQYVLTQATKVEEILLREKHRFPHWKAH